MAKKRQLQAIEVEQLENTSMAILSGQNLADSTTIITPVLPRSICCANSIYSIVCAQAL